MSTKQTVWLERVASQEALHNDKFEFACWVPNKYQDKMNASKCVNNQIWWISKKLSTKVGLYPKLEPNCQWMHNDKICFLNSQRFNIAAKIRVQIREVSILVEMITKRKMNSQFINELYKVS